jgi:hypothetical protein
MRVGEYEKSYGSIRWLGFWASGLCMSRVEAPGEEDIHQSRSTALVGGNLRKFTTPPPHTHSTHAQARFLFWPASKCNALDQPTAAVFDMEIQSDLPEYSLGIQVVTRTSQQQVN